MDFKKYRTIRFERRNNVLHVLLDNPASELNAIDERSHEELAWLFKDLRAERDARAVLLTGGTKKAFCSGGDPGLLLAMRRSVALADATRRDAKQMMADLLDVEIPIVAALNGNAVSLGATIALMCDTIFMADTAIIQDPHVLLGLVAGDGGTVIWPMALGPALAKRYLLTGDPVTADEAHRIGLVTHVTPATDVVPAATAFAERLAAGAPLAVRYTKMAVNQLVKNAMTLSFDSALGHELLTFHSEDLVEALSAMQEERIPDFHGR
jgi:enoyl-CoA hydratase